MISESHFDGVAQVNVASRSRSKTGEQRTDQLVELVDCCRHRGGASCQRVAILEASREPLADVGGRLGCFCKNSERVSTHKRRIITDGSREVVSVRYTKAVEQPQDCRPNSGGLMVGVLASGYFGRRSETLDDFLDREVGLRLQRRIKLSYEFA
jgi:hypothetical protein